MKILFAATQALAISCLQALVEAGYDIEVLTIPDSPQGRGQKLHICPIKSKALELGLFIHQFKRLDAKARETLQHRCELLVSFSYGRIFGPRFLDLFPLGGLNVHPSVLPRWRGPSPLVATILANDTETGVTVQRLAFEVDAGDIVTQSRRKLDGSETTQSLTDWACGEAPSLLLMAIDKVVKTQGLGPFIPQDHSQATFCRPIAKEDALIDWNLCAYEIETRVRAYNSWPGAYTTYGTQRLIIWKATAIKDQKHNNLPTGTVIGLDKSHGILVKTGQGLLAIKELQLQSKKSLDFQTFANGARQFLFCHLGVPT